MYPNWMNRRPLFLIFLIVFIDLMGFGIVIPILPLYGERYHPSPATFGLLVMTFSLMQFIFSPILGRLSDRFGRRPILLISLAGTVVGYVLFAYQRSLAVLFLARIVDGISGGNISTAQAVIADITKPEERAKGMGLVGAAFGLGFIFGPAIGGRALAFGDSGPGLFAAGLSAIAFLLTAVALPETWPPEKRDTANHGHQPMFSVKRLIDALHHPQIGILLVIFFLTTFAFANFEGTFSLFLEKRLSYGPAEVANLFVYIGILAALIQGVLVGRIVKRFGERSLIVSGLILLIPGFLGLIAISSGRQLMALLPALALGTGLVNPSLSSLVSRLSADHEQGGILGVYQSMASLGRIAGPFWGVYSLESHGIAFPYMTAALVTALAACMAFAVLFRWHSAGRPADVPAAGDGESR